jgi:hypothetical protein
MVYLFETHCVTWMMWGGQNLDINRLPSFEPVSNPEFGRFLLETKTMRLDMGICSFSFTGAIIP